MLQNNYFGAFLYTPIKLNSDGTCCDQNTYYNKSSEVFPEEYIDYIETIYGADDTFPGKIIQERFHFQHSGGVKIGLCYNFQKYA